MNYSPKRWCGAKVMIDTNAINARQANIYLNQIEAWRASGTIQLLMPEVAYEEALAGDDRRREEKAGKQVRGRAHRVTADQQKRRDLIERVLFPRGASTESQRNDVEIVYQAAAWSSILVTSDGASRRQRRGILGSRLELAEMEIVVMPPAELVAHVRDLVARRDARVLKVCGARKLHVPSWVGAD